ncbi:MAG: methyl-accepting chemotaxis protein [Magnetococcus sp. YQC-5]
MNKLGPIHLKWFLPTAFIGLIVMLSLLGVMLNYQASLHTAEEAAQTTLTRISQQAMSKILGFLHPASTIVQLNAHQLQFGSGQEPFVDWLNRFTWKELGIYSQFSLVYYGDEQGNHWLNKRERDGAIRMRVVRRLEDSQASRDALRKATEMVSQGKKEEVAAVLAPYLDTTWHGHDASGSLIVQEKAPEFNYDPRLRPWYQGAKERRDLFWTDVYIWHDIVQHVTQFQVGITVSMPVLKAGQLVGVTGIDIVLKDVSEFLASMKISEHGRVFIFNGAGETVALTDYGSVVRKKEGGGIELNRMTKVDDPVIVASYRTMRAQLGLGEQDQIKLPKEQSFTFKESGDRYFAYFKPFAPEHVLNWTIGVVAPEDDFMADAKQEIRRTVIISVISIIIVLFVSIVISRNIIGSLFHLSSEARLISDLDLAVTPSLKTPFVEFVELSRVFSRMKENVRGMVRTLSDQAVRLDGSAGELASVSSSMSDDTVKMNNNADAVAATTLKMSGNMDVIAQAMEEMRGAMNAMVASVEHMNQNMNTIASAAEESSSSLHRVVMSGEETTNNMTHVREAAQRASRNVSGMASALEQMNASLRVVQEKCESASDASHQVSERAQSNSVVMEKLALSAKEIGDVIDVINHIAEQTTMLALNAAIEAAGAGDAGKGFAVVSNEVKNLAHQTGEATKMISQRIEQIRVNTDEVVMVTRSVTTGMERISQANNDILDSVEEQSRSIEEISHAMGNASNETTQVTQRVAEAARGIETVSQSMHDISQGIAEVARNVAEAYTEATGMTRRVAEVSQGADQIAVNVSDASQSSQQIAQTMARMTASIGAVRDLSGSVSQRAENVADIAGELKVMLGKFRV